MMNRGLDTEIPELDGELDVLTPTIDDGGAALLAIDAQPPERVRYAAPVRVELRGDEPCRAEGTAVNLSATGMACLLELALAPGDRLGVRLRLDFVSAPAELECEVVWRKRMEGESSLYGMRFVELDAVSGERLLQIVRERSAGRAGAWPLPLAPAPTGTATARVAPRRAAWRPAVLGMCAGAALTGVIAMLPSVVSGSAPPSAAVASLGERDLEPAASSAAVEPVAQAAVQSTPSTEAKLVATVESPPAAPAPTPQFEAKDEPAPVAPSPTTANGVRVVAHAQGYSFVLPVSGTPSRLESFWLESPRRLVVDASGVKSALGAHEVSLGAPMPGRLRVGVHPNKVRFVVETSVAGEAELHATNGGVAVELRTSRTGR